MLRVYAAAHGMNSMHHAVVEVGAEEIVLRVDTRWVRFSAETMETSSGEQAGFELMEDGGVRIGDVTDEMDMAAERVAREMLLGT
jgi:hypothetical protein